MAEIQDDCIFSSVSQCAEATGTPIEAIKFAVRHADAVDNGNGCKWQNRIHWRLLKPWLEEHEEEIQANADGDYETWRTVQKKAQAQLAEIELQEKRNRTVERQKVHDLLRAISVAQTSLFNSKFRQELLPKLVGKSLPEITEKFDEALAEVFGILHKRIDQWK